MSEESTRRADIEAGRRIADWLPRGPVAGRSVGITLSAEDARVLAEFIWATKEADAQSVVGLKFQRDTARGDHARVRSILMAVIDERDALRSERDALCDAVRRAYTHVAPELEAHPQPYPSSPARNAAVILAHALKVADGTAPAGATDGR